MKITGMGITASMYISTKSPNNEQRSRFTINDINNQDYRKFLKRFKIRLI